MVNVPPLASYDEQGQYRIPWRIPCLEHIQRYLADKAYYSGCPCTSGSTDDSGGRLSSFYRVGADIHRLAG